MKLDAAHGGSGSLAVDEYRAERGQAAAHLLDKGFGANCLSTDHANGTELCTEVIVRKQFDVGKRQIWLDSVGSNLKAADNLRNGIGVHKKQSDHSSNTCAQVIALAT